MTVPTPVPPETLAALRRWAFEDYDGSLPFEAAMAENARAVLDAYDDLAARLAASEAEVARLAAALPACAGCGGAEGPPSHVYGERKCCPECDHRAVPRAEVARLREERDGWKSRAITAEVEWAKATLPDRKPTLPIAARPVRVVRPADRVALSPEEAPGA